MRWLRTAHVYAGLAVVLFVAVLALSGAVLVYKESIWRFSHPELAEPVMDLDASAHAAAIASIQARFPGDVRRIRFPRPGVAAYYVESEQGEAFYHQRNHELIRFWRWHETPMGILTELHLHLAAGKAGREVAGIVGVTCCVLVLIGFWLWWPRRRLFKLRSLLPRDATRASLLKLHWDLGVVAGVFTLWFVLTGVALVYYSAARDLLNAAFSSAPPANPHPLVTTAEPVGPLSAAAIELVQAALPDARLLSYQPPGPGNAVHYFRLKRPGEWHPNGRSVAYIDGRDDRLIVAVDATTQPAGERLAYLIYPLHAAKLGVGLYQVLALVAALALATMSLSGMVSYLKGLRRPRRRRTLPSGQA